MQSSVVLATTPAELVAQLNNGITPDFQPTLAIVFASDAIISPELIEPFRTHNIAVFGGASSEEIAGDTLTNRSVVALLLELPESDFALQTFPPELEGFTSGTAIARWAASRFAHPAVLLLVGGTGVTIDVDALLRGFFSERKDIPLFGGLTSSQDYASMPPFFTNSEIIPDGVYALALDNRKLDLRGVAVSGWSEIGTPKRVTKASGNLVYEIENEPALEFYKKYFKIDPERGDRLLEISEYPIRLFLEDGSRVMRTAIQADLNTGAVQYGGHIPEGSLVRFCSPNILETIKHTIEQIQGFREHSDSAGADAVLLFDCAIRSQSFGSYMRKEIEVINQLWPAPLAGFCSWGEIGRSRGAACGFHNTVISLVLLRDREKINYTANRTYSDEQIEDIVESFPPEIGVEELQREIIQLRKQKSRLSHFLHLTSEDLEQERRKSEELLLNILPASIADRLKIGERTIADRFKEVTIIFADLVGFTPLAGSMDADRLVQILNKLFSSFDELAHKHGVEKIKTIGDAYMAVAGLPEPDAQHAMRGFRFAVGMLKIIHKFNERYHMDIQLRVGLNSGPVVAGVIGKRKFSYDLWGDAVNIASRMESHGVPGSIHLSDSTFQHLKQVQNLQPRGEIEVKGRGPMQTYLYNLSLDTP